MSTRFPCTVFFFEPIQPFNQLPTLEKWCARNRALGVAAGGASEKSRRGRWRCRDGNDVKWYSYFPATLTGRDCLLFRCFWAPRRGLVRIWVRLFSGLVQVTWTCSFVMFWSHQTSFGFKFLGAYAWLCAKPNTRNGVITYPNCTCLCRYFGHGSLF